MNVSTTSTHRHAIRPSTQANQANPGSMTAVMRSMAQATGPKMLRVGVVQDGRVIEDRIIKDRTSVTVGPNEKATFVVGAPGSATPVKLFERVGDSYYLHAVPGMTGRVALESRITDVETLRSVSAPANRVRLSEDARGKLVIGDTTLLFQFVLPPIAESRPQLPLAVKAGLASQIDWNLTIIAAFSFLVHFGVIGAMYSDWMDPILDTEATANGVVDLIRNIPSAPLEMPPSAVEDPAVSAPPTPEPAATTPPPALDHVANPPTPKPMTPSDQAALAAAADAIGVSALTALHADGTAVSKALSSSEIPTVDLGQSAGSIAGARDANGSELHMATGTAAIHPGSTSTDLSTLGRVKVDPNGGRAGPERDTGGPMAVVTLDPPIGPSGGQLSDAPRVVAGLRAGFRHCYNSGLSVDPGMSGRVMLTARVATNGEVASTDASGNVGLSSSVVQCLLRKLGTAQFERVSSPTSVKIPVGFVQQGR